MRAYESAERLREQPTYQPRPSDPAIFQLACCRRRWISPRVNPFPAADSPSFTPSAEQSRNSIQSRTEKLSVETSLPLPPRGVAMTSSTSGSISHWAETARSADDYSFGDHDLFEPYAATGFSSVPGYGNDVVERGQNLMLSETHTIGNRWINEFRFGYNRVRSGTFQENMGSSINRLVGLPDFATRERDLGLSFITVTAFSPLGDEFNNPQDSTVDSHQILDTVNFAEGNHLLQFGFERRWVAQDAFRDVQSRGMINFIGAFTRNPLADLLLGFPDVHRRGRKRQPSGAANGQYRVLYARSVASAFGPDLDAGPALRVQHTGPRRVRRRGGL